MTAMPVLSTQELTRLLESGDLHGLMLIVVAAWVARYHPESRFAVVSADMGGGVPSLIVPITPTPSSPAREPA